MGGTRRKCGKSAGSAVTVASTCTARPRLVEWPRLEVLRATQRGGGHLLALRDEAAQLARSREVTNHGGGEHLRMHGAIGGRVPSACSLLPQGKGYGSYYSRSMLAAAAAAAAAAAHLQRAEGEGEGRLRPRGLAQVLVVVACGGGGGGRL